MARKEVQRSLEMLLIGVILLGLATALTAEQLPPVRLGCAVFSPKSGSNPQGLVVAFGAGLPFTVFETDNPDTVQLTDGSRGLYSCLITIDGRDVSHSQNLRDYQEHFGVRHVILNSDNFGTLSTIRTNSETVKVPLEGDTDFLNGIVRRGSSWPLRKFRLDFFDTEETSFGEHMVQIVVDGDGKTVAFAEGDTLHYASALNDRHLASLALQHVGLQFLLKGQGANLPLQGHRRVLAGAQVDDLFAPPYENMDRRIGTSDLHWWVEWLNDFNEKHGSNIRPELCFNGLGLTLKGYNDPMYFGDYDFGQQYDYSLAGEKEDTYTELWQDHWWNDFEFWKDWIEGDDDYATIAVEIRENSVWRDAFLWLSHTMTHADMGAIGPADSEVELQYSIGFAEVVLNLAGHSNWSPNGVITGMYSGLLSGDFYVAMDNLGMNSVLSDSCHPAHDFSTWTRENYLPFYVDIEHNGYDAQRRIWVVPRHCTACSWDAATWDQNLEKYDPNDEYTTERVMEEELERAGSSLMALRHDPFMFHQANMFVQKYKKGTHSLMSLWIEYVVGGVSDYLAIPIVSEGQDRIAELFDLRAEYAECNPKIYVQRTHESSEAPNYIEIKTEGPCSIPFEALGSVPEQTSGKDAKVSTEAGYTWIEVSSKGTVTFGTEVPVEGPTITTTSTPTATPTTPVPDPVCENKWTVSDSGAECWWDANDLSCASCSEGEESRGCQCGWDKAPHLGRVCVECDTHGLECEVEYLKWLECKAQGGAETERQVSSPSSHMPTLSTSSTASASFTSVPNTETGHSQPPRMPPSRPKPTTKPHACLNEWTTVNTGARCEGDASSMDCGQCKPNSCQCDDVGFSGLGGRVCVPCDLTHDLCPDHVEGFQHCAYLLNIV
eukprot:Clim_evm9s7 gene=Clim_evmTU9s7